MSVSALRGSEQAERKLDLEEFHESEYQTLVILCIHGNTVVIRRKVFKRRIKQTHIAKRGY